MRRKDKEITNIDRIEKIIASTRYMHLGMFDGIVRKKDTNWSASKKTGMYLQKLTEVNRLLQRICLANMEQRMRALCVEVKQ